MHWKVREIKIINKLKRKQQVKEWELAFVSIGLEKKMNSRRFPNIGRVFVPVS